MENGYSMEYGDQYMEQEEEWEREGLLDPAWEKQQKKVRNSFRFISSKNINFNFTKNCVNVRIEDTKRIFNLSFKWELIFNLQKKNAKAVIFGQFRLYT